VSSRAEEKERRRQERLAAEQAAQKSAERRKRLGLVAGGVLAAAIVVVLALVVVAGGDDSGTTTGGDGEGAAIPEQRIDNLSEAARAAGCELSSPRVEGQGHTGEAVQYKTNPPTSGDHDPNPAQDGVYDAGNAPDIEQSVHALEHGRINIQYKKGTPAEQVAQLDTLAGEEVKGEGGYHTLLFENQTNMQPAIAATAWGQSLTCEAFNDRIFDAIRAFRTQYTDKAPEFVP
jgi:hypothetical protein